MAIYETLPAISLAPDNTLLHPTLLPEVVHLEDPALDVMVDFKRTAPITVSPHEPIDNALNEMKVSGVHLLLVTDTEKKVVGLISTEDILGEKPIKFTQERRLTRAEILVRMVMTPQEKVTALDFETLRHARVANIIKTLKELRLNYALVVHTHEDSNKQTIRGIFSSSQISKQVHMDISNSLTEAHSLAELKKRQGY